MIFRNLRHLIEKLFNIDIRIIKNNIYRNTEVVDLNIIECLSKSSGILHIGAHRGSERFIYDWLGKKVLWIEANPKMFVELKKNLREFKFQDCYEGLLYSQNDLLLDFFLSSNDQASSSIYDFSERFKKGKLFFQDKKRNIKMQNKISLKTIKLDSLILKNKLDITLYDHWVIDVQGAELEVLKGAKNSLKSCKSITVEVSTENFYKEGSSYNSIKEFLSTKNFMVKKDPNRNHEDVVFVRDQN